MLHEFDDFIGRACQDSQPARGEAVGEAEGEGEGQMTSQWVSFRVWPQRRMPRERSNHGLVIERFVEILPCLREARERMVRQSGSKNSFGSPRGCYRP